MKKHRCIPKVDLINTSDILYTYSFKLVEISPKRCMFCGRFMKKRRSFIEKALHFLRIY